MRAGADAEAGGESKKQVDGVRVASVGARKGSRVSRETKRKRGEK